ASKNIGKVYSFDKHERGSRRHYSSPEASLAVAKKNIASFGMEARVEALIANAEEMKPSFGIGNIEMVMLDADGRIDRDLFAWRNSISGGAPIFIDDCEDVVRFKYDSKGIWSACFKKRLT